MLIGHCMGWVCTFVIVFVMGSVCFGLVSWNGFS